MHTKIPWLWHTVLWVLTKAPSHTVTSTVLYQIALSLPKFPVPPFVVNPSSQIQTWHGWSTFWCCLFPECYIFRIRENGSLLVWLLSLKKIHAVRIHRFVLFFPFFCWVVFYCMDKAQFVLHSCPDGHLYCFQSLELMNEIAMNINIQVFINIIL